MQKACFSYYTALLTTVFEERQVEIAILYFRT